MPPVAGDSTPRRNHGSGGDTGPDGGARSSPRPCPTSRSTRWSPCSTRSASGAPARAASSSTGRGCRGRSSPSASGELLDRGLVVEGEPGPSHRRPAAAPARRSARTRATCSSRTSGRRRSTSRSRRSTGGSSATSTSRRTSPRARRSRSGRVEELFGQLRTTSRALPGRAVGRRASASRARWSSATGRPISPPIMPGWDGYPVRERFAARFEAPVWVDNDVNVLALGEWRSGVAHGARQRRRRQGRHGHRRRDHRGRPAPPRGAGRRPATSGTSRSSDDRSIILCRCGNTGCLEALAGGAAIGARRRDRGAATAGRARLRGRPRRRGAGHRGGRGAGGVVRRSRWRSSCSRPRAGGSARCSPASSTSSTRR